LEFQLKKRGDRPLYIEPEFTQVSDNVVIASARLEAPHGRQERYQVVTFRDGKIADMQGFTRRRQAERYARNR
jgi:hypothetical protein